MGVEGKVSCGACGAAAAPGAVDVRRSVLVCTHCGVTTELTGAAGLPGARPGREAPPGIVVEEDGDVLRLRWDWAGWVPKPVFVGAVVWVSFFTTCAFGAKGSTLVLVIYYLLFAGPGLVGIYCALAGFLNSTRVRADAKTIEVRHGPLPMPGRRGHRLASTEIAQLSTLTRVQAVFDKQGMPVELRARLRNGRAMVLARLQNATQALFVERRLEALLRLEDQVVAFEPVEAAPGGPAPFAKPSTDALPCTGCGGALDLRDVDRGKGTVRCRFCGTLVVLNAAALAAAPRSPLEGLEIPDHLDASFEGGTLTVRWKWVPWGMLPVVAVAWAKSTLFIAVGTVLLCVGSNKVADTPWIGGALAIPGILFYFYYCLGRAVNRSEVVVTREEVRTRHGPLPWIRSLSLAAPGVRNAEVDRGPHESERTAGKTFDTSFRVTAIAGPQGRRVFLAASLTREGADLVSRGVNAALREAKRR